jgi:2-keto-4-pentenoate hydratase/2-oxohepta-3-ene-1,7-dioic acid hydratase in catechol pathway
MDPVLGYSACNDTTVQKIRGGQWCKGKRRGGGGPMGPWITMAEDILLDHGRIICRVNGVEKQNGSYCQMFFKIPRIIAELSRKLTLEPGDSRKPPECLQPGDLMETEITGVGIIRNRVRVQVGVPGSPAVPHRLSPAEGNEERR